MRTCNIPQCGDHQVVRSKWLWLPFLLTIATVLIADRSVGAQDAKESLAPTAVRLWPEGAPGAVGNEDADHPDIRVYLPAADKATGAAVVICPGGGYGILAYDHEGHQVARWLNTIGVAGVVLKYRLAPRYRHPAPLADVQRAIRTVRAQAETWQIDPRRVGVMGFSAGGHLASTAATHFDPGQNDAVDPIDRLSCRPDFAVLCYPVISFTESFGHAGSKRNLLGADPDPKLVESLSNERQVTEQTPPTFLFHTADDTGVPPENSLAFFTALRRAKVPCELHVYEVGPHGVGLSPADPATFGWKDRLADWLRARGLLSAATRAAVQGSVTVGGTPLRWGMIAFQTDDPRQPLAWTMVANGRFSIPANRGPAVGLNRVTLINLGAVEPRPTIPDHYPVPGKVESKIQAGMNDLQLSWPTAK